MSGEPTEPRRRPDHDAPPGGRTLSPEESEALDARIAEWQRARAARPAEPTAALWLAHHHAGQYDRCWSCRGRLVCRRCTLLWPLAFVVMVASRAGSWWPADLDPVLLVALPLPGVVEFGLEHFGVVRYHATRQLLLTVPVAVAVGRLLARYLDDHGDALFWGVVWGYAIVMFAATVVGTRRSRRAGAPPA